ncbi:uncharacterized protein LOC135076509 [Ostrinia nubilalis]|uniref:uncharacterized protein LOC135076509 n=1 Tax=Ostrinia nubilalis TaxID=29057 RepID=UPI00308248C4
MNFQTSVVFPSLKVLVVNPLTPSGQMVTIKILSGLIFGENQLIDLILLVYSNEKPIAERMKIELITCAYCCYNTITVSSDLPSISDADVFCFMSNFYNLNKIELDKVDNDDQFDALYLIIKIANNFSRPESIKEEPIDDGVKFVKRSKKPKPIPRKPIFMADGLAAMDILMSLAKNMPHDIFFCPSPLPYIAKSVLGEYLKVQCNEINDVLVWAANDEVFHVEVEKPMIIHDQMNDESKCDWDMVGKDLFRSFDFDHTQFSPSWMKKEFIEKVSISSSKNPYGSIFRAALFAKALKSIWQSRTIGADKKFYCCMGVISDGSLGTMKGYPYVLPLIFNGDTWTVNKRFEETAHLRNELKRINRAVREHHQILIPYCKRFLQDNVINQAFIPVPVESSSEYSSVANSSKTSMVMQ